MAETCLTCRFALVTPARHPAVPTVVCRYHAPQPRVTWEPVAPEPGRLVLAADWPEVLHDDWCGEFEARPADPFDPTCTCGHPRSEHDYTGDDYDRSWGRCETFGGCACRRYVTELA